MAAPALVALVTLAFGWRVTLLGLGLFGLGCSLLVGLAHAWVRPPPTSHRAPDPAGIGSGSAIPPAYWLLTMVGMLDATTRAAALTFLPFAL
jgi:hypothetical protein